MQEKIRLMTEEELEQLCQKRPDSMTYIACLMKRDAERLKQSSTDICFDGLNKKTGGINSGLYVIAAAPSLGKTTFALQIADGFAASGKDVIFFSLEQSRLEMVSKSFARIAAQRRLDAADQIDPAAIESSPCSLAIRSDQLTAEQQKEVSTAQREYFETIGDRMSIIEVSNYCGVSDIAGYVQRYIDRTGTRPIIFIDYLQSLQPIDCEHRTEKKKTDENITALKRLSRYYNITIFVISAINRSNYTNRISHEALKESGGIECIADVIWGLQMFCMNDSIFDSATRINEKREIIAKECVRNPREVEIVCLKNKYGVSNFKQSFFYFPANDLYVEKL